MTEQELINGCLKGNRKAQAMLYERFAGLVMGVARRYSQNDNEAEDVFQEAFVKVFDNIGKVENAAALAGWIKRISVNTAINYFRKHSKHHGHAPEEMALANATVDEDALSSLGNEELLYIIQQLPKGYQLVFNLYAIEGYNHREIGELMGISEGTSKSQYARARAMLQASLGRLGFSAKTT